MSGEVGTDMLLRYLEVKASILLQDRGDEEIGVVSWTGEGELVSV